MRHHYISELSTLITLTDAITDGRNANGSHVLDRIW